MGGVDARGKLERKIAEMGEDLEKKSGEATKRLERTQEAVSKTFDARLEREHTNFMSKVSDTNDELGRRTEALEKRLQDMKDRIEAEQVAKFEEQDMRMDEFRRSSETAQRTQERETRQALVQQKEESDDKFADMKKVMAAK